MAVNLPLLAAVSLFATAIFALTVGFCFAVADNSGHSRRRPIRRRAA